MQMTATLDKVGFERKFKPLFDEGPVGDPFGGPAYGQLEKSKGLGMVVGIVASVVTMGAALPMLASTALATQIAGGVMFAGGALGGVGAVTGNKKLSKIGGIMSLAGGLGGLAAGGLSSAGAGGAFAPGSGSSALQNFAGNMMESVNGISGGLGLGDIYSSGSVASARSAIDVPQGAAPAAGEFGPTAADVPSASLTPEGGPTITPAGDAALVKDPLSTDTGFLSRSLKPETMKLGGVDDMVSNAAAVPGGNAPISTAPAADSVANPMSEWPAAGASNGGSGSGLLSRSGSANSWLKENAELVKLSMGALEKGVGAAMSPDQQAELDARAKLYGAQASMLATQQDVLEYQRNNMSKQVAMISADDPDLDNKVKSAAGKGIPVVFIPSIGAGGVSQTGGAWNAGAGNMAQTPVRQATFATKTV